MVYRFGGGVDDGGNGDKSLLGGKGANLDAMAALGLPVPPGFTITTEVCSAYFANGKLFPDVLTDAVTEGVEHIERVTGKGFGDITNPLLVSVRSGARVSMPGMMDTVLNLGLNDATVEGLAIVSGHARFAWDCYRRFIQMYADVVLGLDHNVFESELEIAKENCGVILDADLTVDDLQALVGNFKELVKSRSGKPFPQDVQDQLWESIGAVFASWDSDRARVYRQLNHIPTDWGTAVNVQAMVFGNMDSRSATGVAFTRSPVTGERAYYGEFLINAQGEDVVAGIRTPGFLTKVARHKSSAMQLSMEEAMPHVYSELARVLAILETHYRDMQDIEFTVERGQLWMLQTRSGKRTAKAALRIAVDMANEGLITRHEAILRVDPAAIDQLLHPMLDPAAPRDVLTKGLSASPGAAAGYIAFDSGTAEKRSANGDAVILVRSETSPEDIHGMHAAKGILTARGGVTSHAAVVARAMGRPCVSGASALVIDVVAKSMSVGARKFGEGDIITIDGTTGEVIVGRVPTIAAELAEEFTALMRWADAARRMKIRANAETPLDAKVALDFGAEGIGLCRTEHMFFDTGRITTFRQMILSEDEDRRRAALARLLPEQRNDFTAIFEVMVGLPVTIRLLDPPLHEFLPQTTAEFANVAAVAGVDIDTLKRRAAQLHEFNPMLGHRGCRLGITYPEIYEMQARAIFEAACSLETAPVPEIMIPLVATRRELDLMKNLVDETAEAVFEETGKRIDYLVGTMIELPRAALRAGDMAEAGEFFSFGTNDLTQTTLGVSRDDAARFLTSYVDKGIYARDPFVSLDVDGVGELIKLAVERGRLARPNLKIGICGEHGGDPASIDFCESVGIDYVSASPYRVPVARLAAAQAGLRHENAGI
jgi:pyruvate,orthophosphate dikinase